MLVSACIHGLRPTLTAKKGMKTVSNVFFYLKIVIYSLKLSSTQNLRLEIELQRLIQQRVNEDVLKKVNFWS